MDYRDHQPVVIDKFNGLFDRNDPDSVPLDHAIDCNNVAFVGPSTVQTRPGIGISQSVGVPLSNVKRIYNYPTNEGNTYIVLTYDDDADEGSIHHVVDATTVHGPLLTIAGMTDFAFLPYAGRGYISPFTSFDQNGLNIEKGLEGEFLYVYLGDGTAATKAAGAGLGTSALTIANGAAGHTDPGLHIFGFVPEYDTGYLGPPSQLTTFSTSAASSVSFGNVGTNTGDPHIVKRHLVASKKITSFNGDKEGYQLFFVPDAIINNNTDTFLNNVSFYDADLLDDASHLLENFTEIPAGAVLTLYHNRLCLAATFDEISVIYVSADGEPEAIDQIDGLVAFPPDGNPITNMAELRDILYVTKRAKTVSYSDNGDVPSSWDMVLVDNALGSSVHGITSVLDSGSASVDFLIICTYQGISLFNGRYITPELSWKIEGFWQRLNRNEFRKLQIINLPISKTLMIVLPGNVLLYGNYSNGMDPMKIRWAPWTFTQNVNCICVWQVDTVIIGADV